MLGFFNKKKVKKQGEDSFADSNELLTSIAGSESASEADVKTKLSIHPSWNLSPEDKYIYQFAHNELPMLKANQISLSGIEMKRAADGSVQILAFVRNSLAQPIKFEKVTLLLVGPADERLGRKEFDLSQLGELPAESSRPWVFQFDSNDLTATELPSSGWKLAFELKKKHQLDLEESWDQSLADEDKAKLEKMVEQIQPPKPGEVNFMGISAQQASDGDLHITMLIRNGSDKNIKLEQLPLEVVDASGEVVARGGFSLKDFEVKANTSKPWTFIFPKSLMLKDEPDLSQWKAYPPQPSNA